MLYPPCEYIYMDQTLQASPVWPGVTPNTQVNQALPPAGSPGEPGKRVRLHSIIPAAGTTTGAALLLLNGAGVSYFGSGIGIAATNAGVGSPIDIILQNGFGIQHTGTALAAGGWYLQFEPIGAR